MLVALVGALLLQQAAAVIYKLNATDYYRMPPLHRLDDWSSCMVQPGAVYCVLDIHLKGDSDLMRMIQGYSEHTPKHYNYTQLHRGVCVTRTCKEYLKDYNTASDVDIRKALTTCLNQSIYKEYKLEGEIQTLHYCEREGDETMEELGTGYIVMAVVYLIIILLNTAGSFYDSMLSKKGEKTGNAYLLAFSIPRNWSKLVATVDSNPDPRMERLRCFHGLRSITMVCVFFAHTALVMAYTYVANPNYIESMFDDVMKLVLLNGNVVVSTFFTISAFLMAYNIEIHAEKNKISLSQWPKGILLRWLRLTPVYALVLFTTMTWMSRLSGGPLWQYAVGAEAVECRRYWWAHLLFIHNYIYDDVNCIPQTWYLASDTQLFCVGLLICLLARTARARKIVLSGVFVVSILINVAQTYFQDMNAVVLQSPENYRTLYAQDDTFRIMYIQGHTGLSTYAIGLACGFLTYHWQKEKKDFEKYKRLRFLVWLVVPAGVGLMLSGSIFYQDGPPQPLVVRLLFAAFLRPVFQLLVVVLIVAWIFKIESVYRRLLEWRGFTWTSRACYSGFLLHVQLLRIFVGLQQTLLFLSDYSIVIMLSAITLLSFALGALLFVFVESPLAGVTRQLLRTSSKTDK